MSYIKAMIEQIKKRLQENHSINNVGECSCQKVCSIPNTVRHVCFYGKSEDEDVFRVDFWNFISLILQARLDNDFIGLHSPSKIVQRGRFVFKFYRHVNILLRNKFS